MVSILHTPECSNATWFFVKISSTKNARKKQNPLYPKQFKSNCKVLYLYVELTTATSARNLLERERHILNASSASQLIIKPACSNTRKQMALWPEFRMCLFSLFQPSISYVYLIRLKARKRTRLKLILKKNFLEIFKILKEMSLNLKIDRISKVWSLILSPHN